MVVVGKFLLEVYHTELMTVSIISSFPYFRYIYFLDKLRKYFEVYGRVQDAVVMKDPISKRSRGFGFITFEDIDSVDNALSHEIHTIDSRRVLL